MSFGPGMVPVLWDDIFQFFKKPPENTGKYEKITNEK